ncbi:50S ribosomal protein 6 chloroplastic, partial [Phtheirospermum japonicum]
LTQYILFFISEPPNDFSTTNSRLVVPPPSSAATKVARSPQRLVVGGGCGLVIECSSRPQKRATKHHMKTRPRKSCPPTYGVAPPFTLCFRLSLWSGVSSLRPPPPPPKLRRSLSSLSNFSSFSPLLL